MNNEDLKLLPNVNVNVTIVTGEHSNVLTLPREAVHQDGGKPYVFQIVDGVLELYGGIVQVFLRRCTLLEGGASAMTLGHVVVGRDREALEWSRAHERVHVRQAERWGGLFLPAYGVGSLIAMIRGGRAYLDNPFEKEAYEVTS